MEQDIARDPKGKTGGSRQPISNHTLPKELILTLLAQGYPLEELLEEFPMFNLDQLMLLLNDDIAH